MTSAIPLSLPSYPGELKSIKALIVRVVTPGGILWQGTAQAVILPTPEGEMGILRGHIALTTPLDVGVLRIRNQQRSFPIYLLGGWAQVEADLVTILVQRAERGEEIDPQIAQSGLERAASALKQAQSPPQKLKATAAFKQAQARWKACQSFK